MAAGQHQKMKMEKNNLIFTERRNDSQKGSIFFYILLGIVLFSALAFTVSRGFRGQSVNALTDRKAELVATSILDYAQEVRYAVDLLRRRGCSETQFNFNPPSENYYTNPNSPVDGSCDVFGVSGGNVLSQDALDMGALDQAMTGWAAGPDNWYISSYALAISGVGPTSIQRADLVMWTWYVNDKVCMAINKILGIENTNGLPPKDVRFDFGGTKYNGTINVAYNSRIVNTTANETEGEEAGCFFDNDGTGERNYFYQVLIAE